LLFLGRPQWPVALKGVYPAMENLLRFRELRSGGSPEMSVYAVGSRRRNELIAPKKSIPAR